MKSYALVLIAFLLCPILIAQNFTIPETPPSFKRGEVADFLQERLQYPAAAKEQKIKGSVLVAFVLNEEGVVVEQELVSNIGAGCGEEAMRLIQLTSGLWESAVHDGQNVSSIVHQRIYFDSSANTNPVVSAHSNASTKSNSAKTPSADRSKSKDSKKERTREDRIQVLFNLGRKNFKEEKYSKARHYFQKVLELQPEDENTLYNLALTKIKLKDDKGACADLEALATKGNVDAILMLEKVCQ